MATAPNQLPDGFGYKRGIISLRKPHPDAALMDRRCICLQSMLELFFHVPITALSAVMSRQRVHMDRVFIVRFDTVEDTERAFALLAKCCSIIENDDNPDDPVELAPQYARFIDDDADDLPKAMDRVSQTFMDHAVLASDKKTQSIRELCGKNTFFMVETRWVRKAPLRRLWWSKGAIRRSCSDDACGKTSDSCRIKVCNRCFCFAFCSNECQREHWPEHKELCDKMGDKLAHWLAAQDV